MRTLLLALLSFPLLAAGDDSLATVVQAGFAHFYNLEYDAAIDCFQKAIRLDPKSPDLHNHLAQTLVFREMFRDGALESEMVSGNNAFLRRAKLNPTAEIEREFLGELSQAMALAQQRLDRNANDTGALYAMGVAYGLRSNYYWVVKKSWRDSLRDATTARKLHQRVAEIDPKNVDVRLALGLHDYIVGSLPFMLRMVGFLAGIHGDREKGLREVQDVALHGSLNKVDAEVFLGALYRREGHPEKAVPLVQDLIRRFPRNYLLRLELSQMCSMAGDGKSALEAVDEVARMKQRHEPGYDRVPWEKIWFQEGTIQFWYDDLDHALENMKKVTAASSEVDLNTGVWAWLRLGQIYDLTHHRDRALEAYRRAIAYAPQAEAAQESKKYLSSPYHRDPA